MRYKYVLSFLPKTGNADSNALQLAVSTMHGCQLIGMPECDVLLNQCTIYLARAPKSREADDVLRRAKNLIKNIEGPQPSVPLHLRNAPTKLMRELGNNKTCFLCSSNIKYF